MGTAAYATQRQDGAFMIVNAASEFAKNSGICLDYCAWNHGKGIGEPDMYFDVHTLDITCGQESVSGKFDDAWLAVFYTQRIPQTVTKLRKMVAQLKVKLDQQQLDCLIDGN